MDTKEINTVTGDINSHSGEIQTHSEGITQAVINHRIGAASIQIVGQITLNITLPDLTPIAPVVILTLMILSNVGVVKLFVKNV